MKTTPYRVATSSKKPVAKKPVAHRRSGVRQSVNDRKVDEIVRLARKLKGAFGPT